MVTIVAVEVRSSCLKAAIQERMSKKSLNISALETTSDTCHERYKKRFHDNDHEVGVRPLHIRQRNQVGSVKKKC
jgi:hypothetical protein